MYKLYSALKGFGGLGQRVRSRSRRRHPEQRQSHWPRRSEESGEPFLSFVR
jgi:hypothetical protein